MKRLLWLMLGCGIGLVLIGLITWNPLQRPEAGEVTPGPTATEPGALPLPSATDEPPTPDVQPTEPPATVGPTAAPLNLIWQREGGVAGLCDRLTLDADLRASYGPCTETAAHAALDPAEAEFYRAYLERYAGFQWDRAEAAAGAQTVTVRLWFAGQGARVPDEPEQAELESWVTALYERLIGDRRREELIAMTRVHLAARLGIAQTALQTLAVEAVTWPDTCLGLTVPGVFCAQAATPGYRITLQAAGRLYEYRSDLFGYILPVLPPPTQVPTALPSPTLLPSATPWPTHTPRPTPTPWPTYPTVILGWLGEYYANPTLDGAPIMVRDDAGVHFDWGYDSPAAVVPQDFFSARWRRRIYFSEGRYDIRLESDDGARLWIGGRLLLDRWHGGHTSDVLDDIWLWEGEHEVVLEYFELQGVAKVHLDWQKQQDRPTRTPVITEWRAEYFNNRELSGDPRIVRNESQISFDWGDGSPAKEIERNRFSARFSRELNLIAGPYRVRAEGDDGFRVYIDDTLVIDRWEEGPVRAEQVDLTLDKGIHKVRVEYFEN
ncbi:MAG: hypothetical protein JXA74_01425, partial [Anaerolineae bacterium]|nr:hypothetical protein [Anaerolineae bacterium]